jgi:hypothetical protein
VLVGLTARPATLIISTDAASAKLYIPFFSLGDYYDFLSTTMIVLFIVGLVIVFVYEYEALRRSKT